MVRLRALVWLAALFAFVVPTLAMTSAGHARDAAQQAAADCPDHAPPPDPCPAKGTAKHAAGNCCPLMSSTLALLPTTTDGNAMARLRAPVTKPARSLVGYISAKDTPPPRV